MSAADKPFNDAERERFHALLKLAAESPFEGERTNALAAADRLALQHGMTLEEASTAPQQGPMQEPFIRPVNPERARAEAELGGVVNLMDHFVHTDKARREAALKEAYERGLDGAERKARNRPATPRFRRTASRRNPEAHAHVLLAETSLPLIEIVSLTGLDIYEVVGMKLKMRRVGAA